MKASELKTEIFGLIHDWVHDSSTLDLHEDIERLVDEIMSLLEVEKCMDFLDETIDEFLG